jgi:hypothetical protein
MDRKFTAISDSAAAIARRLYPEAFRRSGLTKIGLVFDSTGAVIRHNALVAPELSPFLNDRVMMEELFPGIPITRLAAWGINTPGPSDARTRVAIFWGSVGSPPWVDR